MYFAIREQLETQGFSVVDRIFTAKEIAELTSAITRLAEHDVAKVRAKDTESVCQVMAGGAL
jgi:hypothetical protein